VRSFLDEVARRFGARLLGKKSTRSIEDDAVLSEYLPLLSVRGDCTLPHGRVT